MLFCSDSCSVGAEPFRIQILDQSNQWPVPLVELRTTHHVRLVSDNNGFIAFDLPELMGTETWFELSGNGYTVPEDGFGYRGVRLTPRPGEQATIEVHREYPAKRLGRITGIGRFAESQKLGQAYENAEQQVLGCDSVQNAIYQDRLFWIWGDTTIASYPLGIFNTLGGTTVRRPIPTYAPPIRLEYDYFLDHRDRIRGVANIPGDGPTWLTGLVTLLDSERREHLVATYQKIAPPLTVYEYGQCEWDDTVAKFVPTRVLWSAAESPATTPPSPQGHAVNWQDEQGKAWVLFGEPFPTLKMEATYESWRDPSRWIALESQKRVPIAGSLQLRADQTKTEIDVHRGSIVWNEYKRKWVTLFTQLSGDQSYLGAIWYAESPTPFGPWSSAVQVADHDGHSFYNPLIHAEWTDADGSILLFEGTFTKTFAKAVQAIPRYEYNQVLYRLDLKDLPQSRDTLFYLGRAIYAGSYSQGHLTRQAGSPIMSSRTLTFFFTRRYLRSKVQDGWR
jgi:hypothetical protein